MLKKLKLSQDERNYLDRDITFEEFTNALKRLKKGQTPGCDRLSPELLLSIWDVIDHMVYNAIIYACEIGHLHLSARRGIITLIPKKELDTAFLKSQCPLTVLNTDFKILAKLLTLRIDPYLPKLIHSDQTGFMKNRNISHNICKIIDILQYVRDNNIEVLLILLDFEKAFDRVEHKVVQETLKLLNFGTKIILMINVLYTDFEHCTINLGHTSQWFKPTCDLYQGNPISSTIFILVIEVLGDQIRSNPYIKGTIIDTIEYKAIHLADNMNKLSTNSQKSLNNIIDTLTLFEQNTGLRLNYDKTNVYHTGSLTNTNAMLNQVITEINTALRKYLWD